MKRLLLLSLFFAYALLAEAQVKVNFGIGLSTEDFTLRMSFNREQETPYLVVVCVSESCQWGDEPRLLIKLMNDSVMDLSGRLFSTNTASNNGVAIGNIFTSSSEIHSIALFPISEQDISRFSIGIKKIRPNLLPKSKDKEWTTDVLGVKLIKEFVRTPTFKEDF